VGYQAAAVASGMAADVVGREARVRWLEAQQNLLEREGEVDDLTYKLADVLGLPAGIRLELADPAVPPSAQRDVDALVAEALATNPEVMEARALIEKATHGVRAARADYIPMIGLVGGHMYQNSVPFFPKNFFAVGITGSWTIFDWGARRNTVAERRAQLGQAQRSREIVERRVRGDVEAALRKVARSRTLLDLAEDAQSLRVEGARLRILQASVGYAVDAQQHEANAERMEADLDLLKAQLGYLIALSELERATGALSR
jgi:outer membrane protein TolC